MRFLKMKIQNAQLAEKKISSEELENSNPNTINSQNIPDTDPNPLEINQTKEEDLITDSTATKQSLEKKKRRKRKVKKILQEDEEDQNCTKNITINYGKAIASFAISYIAIPYLKIRLQNNIITFSEFTTFMTKAKSDIGGIQGFRTLLLVEETDTPKVAACKNLFQYISETFVKYFSVNWIIHSKLTHKLIYLKYRFKMLRRIQNPEFFTYIKDQKKK